MLSEKRGVKSHVGLLFTNEDEKTLTRDIFETCYTYRLCQRDFDSAISYFFFFWGGGGWGWRHYIKYLV